MSYILCQRKRNLPRIDTRICESRCPDRDGCRDFLNFQAGRQAPAQPPSPAEDRSAAE